MHPTKLKPSKSQGASDSYDSLDHGLQGGKFLLSLVEQAAEYAPIPYLQQAAGTVLAIFNTIAEVKNNKEDFQRLANDAISLIAAIWRSYQISNNKDQWPSRALRDIILDLVGALDSIVQFVASRKNKTWVIRAIYASLDAQKISEYREKLTSAVQRFQVASDLNVNDMLFEVLKKQDAMLAHLAKPVASLHPSRPHPSLEVPQYGYGDGPSQPPVTLETPHSFDSPPGPHIATPPHAGETAHTRLESSRGFMAVEKMSFSNIKNSGIAIGGGHVRIVNG